MDTLFDPIATPMRHQETRPLGHHPRAEVIE